MLDSKFLCILLRFVIFCKFSALAKRFPMLSLKTENFIAYTGFVKN